MTDDHPAPLEYQDLFQTLCISTSNENAECHRPQPAPSAKSIHISLNDSCSSEEFCKKVSQKLLAIKKSKLSEDEDQSSIVEQRSDNNNLNFNNNDCILDTHNSEDELNATCKTGNVHDITDDNRSIRKNGFPKITVSNTFDNEDHDEECCTHRFLEFSPRDDLSSSYLTEEPLHEYFDVWDQVVSEGPDDVLSGPRDMPLDEDSLASPRSACSTNIYSDCFFTACPNPVTRLDATPNTEQPTGPKQQQPHIENHLQIDDNHTDIKNHFLDNPFSHQHACVQNSERDEQPPHEEEDEEEDIVLLLNNPAPVQAQEDLQAKHALNWSLSSSSLSSSLSFSHSASTSSGSNSPSPRKRQSTLIDYNSLFQTLLERNQITREEQLKVLENIGELATTFQQHAALLARKIIEMPREKRKSISLDKGIAGGEKFLLEGIFFKYARDNKGMYGGDQYAQKVAGHELRSMIELTNMRIPDLHLPLACIVDYGGHRLLALSQIEISSASLVYGSSDAGKTFQFGENDPQVQSLAKRISRDLNLAPHIFKGKWIYTCADLEIHRAKDNRLYLIDAARLWPPVYDEQRKHQKGGVFFNLMRPEFLKTASNPLNPDTFTGFSLSDPNRKRHEKNLFINSAYLLEKNCLALARDITMNYTIKSGLEGINTFFHRHGVNARDSMKVISFMKENPKHKFLVLESTSRSVKTVVKNAWRKVKASLTYEADLKVILWEILYGCLHSQQSHLQAVFAELKNQFHIPVTDVPHFVSFIQQHFSIIFSRMQTLLQFQVADQKRFSLEKIVADKNRFCSLVKIQPRIKAYPYCLSFDIFQIFEDSGIEGVEAHMVLLEDKVRQCIRQRARLRANQGEMASPRRTSGQIDLPSPRRLSAQADLSPRRIVGAPNEPSFSNKMSAQTDTARYPHQVPSQTDINHQPRRAPSQTEINLHKGLSQSEASPRRVPSQTEINLQPRRVPSQTEINLRRVPSQTEINLQLRRVPSQTEINLRRVPSQTEINLQPRRVPSQTEINLRRVPSQTEINLQLRRVPSQSDIQTNQADISPLRVPSNDAVPRRTTSQNEVVSPRKLMNQFEPSRHKIPKIPLTRIIANGSKADLMETGAGTGRMSLLLNQGSVSSQSLNHQSQDSLTSYSHIPLGASQNSSSASSQIELGLAIPADELVKPENAIIDLYSTFEQLAVCYEFVANHQNPLNNRQYEKINQCVALGVGYRMQCMEISRKLKDFQKMCLTKLKIAENYLFFAKKFQNFQDLAFEVQPDVVKNWNEHDRTFFVTRAIKSMQSAICATLGLPDPEQPDTSPHFVQSPRGQLEENPPKPLSHQNTVSHIRQSTVPQNHQNALPQLQPLNALSPQAVSKAQAPNVLSKSQSQHSLSKPRALSPQGVSKAQAPNVLSKSQSQHSLSKPQSLNVLPQAEDSLAHSQQIPSQQQGRNAQLENMPPASAAPQASEAPPERRMACCSVFFNSLILLVEILNNETVENCQYQDTLKQFAVCLLGLLAQSNAEASHGESAESLAVDRSQKIVQCLTILSRIDPGLKNFYKEKKRELCALFNQNLQWEEKYLEVQKKNASHLPTVELAKAYKKVARFYAGHNPSLADEHLKKAREIFSKLKLENPVFQIQLRSLAFQLQVRKYLSPPAEPVGVSNLRTRRWALVSLDTLAADPDDKLDFNSWFELRFSEVEQLLKACKVHKFSHSIEFFESYVSALQLLLNRMLHSTSAPESRDFQSKFQIMFDELATINSNSKNHDISWILLTLKNRFDFYKNSPLAKSFIPFRQRHAHPKNQVWHKVVISTFVHGVEKNKISLQKAQRPNQGECHLKGWDLSLFFENAKKFKEAALPEICGWSQNLLTLSDEKEDCVFLVLKAECADLPLSPKRLAEHVSSLHQNNLVFMNIQKGLNILNITFSPLLRPKQIQSVKYLNDSSGGIQEVVSVPSDQVWLKTFGILPPDLQRNVMYTDPAGFRYIEYCHAIKIDIFYFGLFMCHEYFGQVPPSSQAGLEHLRQRLAVRAENPHVQIVLDCLSNDPAQRPSFGEIIAALNSFKSLDDAISPQHCHKDECVEVTPTPLLVAQLEQKMQGATPAHLLPLLSQLTTLDAPELEH